MGVQGRGLGFSNRRSADAESPRGGGSSQGGMFGGGQNRGGEWQTVETGCGGKSGGTRRAGDTQNTTWKQRRERK